VDVLTLGDFAHLISGVRQYKAARAQSLEA
jgi:hypothetical protein